MVLSLNLNIVSTVWTGILELTIDYNSDLFFIKYGDYFDRLVVHILELFISTSTTILLLMCNALFWFELQHKMSQLGINKVHHIRFIFSHLIETKPSVSVDSQTHSCWWSVWFQIQKSLCRFRNSHSVAVQDKNTPVTLGRVPSELGSVFRPELILNCDVPYSKFLYDWLDFILI